MRLVFLRAVLALAAVATCATPAAAQSISAPAGEITFSGLFTTDGPDNIPQTPDDVLGAPLATVNLSGIGYVTGGALFSPGALPGYPFSPVYRPGVPSDERGANYSFVFDAGPGVIVDPFTGPGDPSVVTEYASGTLNIFRVPNVPAVPTNNTFGSGTPANRASFADGVLYLSMNFTSLRHTFDPRFGQGSIRGQVQFTGGEIFNAFLAPNNLTTGTINAQTNVFDPNTVANPVGGSYDFAADGRIDVAGGPVQPPPPNPTARIGDLIAQVESANLQKGIENSFVVKLEAALAALGAGETAEACASLEDFINHARAQSGKKLTTAQAQAFVNAAQAIRTDLGC